MRFYTKQHRYCREIDLHARSMYVCILDPQGKILLHRNMSCAPKLLLKAVASYPRRHCTDLFRVSLATFGPWSRAKMRMINPTK